MTELPPQPKKKPASGNSSPRSGSRRPTHLPGGIWVLGLVSMLMDISSELIHSLLPVLMASVLGASMITIGIIEGIAEATAAIAKVFSGAISDYFRRRKFLLVLGYGLGAITKPVFPLATTIDWVFGARFMDRIGKGIRGAPRDALIADLTPPQLLGAAYGLRQSLDSVGAFLGPLLAIGLMLLLANDIQSVLWAGVIPAFLAVSLLTLALKEPEKTPTGDIATKKLQFADCRRLSRGYWQIVALGAIFTLARFSEAFLILRAQETGLSLSYLPAVMIAMNLVYAAFAYPAGILADRLSTRTLLLWGLGALIVADIVLARAISPAAAFMGAMIWGLHMALSQGLLAKLVATTAPAELRGTAFGVFNLTTGIALLLASVIAGTLWSRYGSGSTFLAGAGFAAVAAAGLLFHRSQSPVDAGRKNL